MSSDAQHQAESIEHGLSAVRPIETEIIAFKGFMLTKNKCSNWDVRYMFSGLIFYWQSIAHSFRTIQLKLSIKNSILYYYYFF